jgi:TPR repeat protein
MRFTINLIIISFFLLTNNCYASDNVKTDLEIGLEYISARNFEKAFKPVKESAEQGHPEAQYNLGVMYDNGDGVLKDPKQAVVWYRKAAEQGHPSAQHNLGVMYGNGEGVLKDPKQALAWWRKAAEQGNSTAQFNVGIYYAEGIGVLKDMKMAKKFIQKAHENGYERAAETWESLELWKY